MADAAGSLLAPKTEERDEFKAAGPPAGHSSSAAAPALQTPKPWTIPSPGLAVFHGSGKTARLSHYFLPRLLLEGKRILYLDGANSADPRLIARMARERGVAFQQFSQQIQIARAFTCFQLTELIARVPRFIETFPAQVLMVTALPDLYFDGDVRDWDARMAFEQALRDLRRLGSGGRSLSRRGLGPPDGDEDATATETRAAQASSACRQAPPPLSVVVFSSAPNFTAPPARKRFFDQTCAAATEVWKFDLDEAGKAKLLCTRSEKIE